MSREIKFRAWDIKNKRFVNIVSIVLDQFGALDYVDVVYKGKIYKLYPSEVVLEQDTGLKDKNGKEIFEGDITAQTLVDDPFSKKYPNYVVHWDEEFLSWALKDVSGDDGNDTDLHFFIEEWKKCEVIGNIHENPELLDDSIHGPYGPIGEENIGGESRRMKNE